MQIYSVSYGMRQEKQTNKQKASHFRSFNQKESGFSVVKTVAAAVDGYFSSTQHVTQSYVNFLVHQNFK